jgi:hypothetical protein
VKENDLGSSGPQLGPLLATRAPGEASRTLLNRLLHASSYLELNSKRDFNVKWDQQESETPGAKNENT